MSISFDPRKRALTLTERGLDFADAEKVFEGPKFEFVDDRNDYGEIRITTVGLMGGRMVVLVWTERGGHRHIISMRRANDREQRRYQERMD